MGIQVPFMSRSINNTSSTTPKNDSESASIPNSTSYGSMMTSTYLTDPSVVPSPSKSSRQIPENANSTVQIEITQPAPQEPGTPLLSQ